MLPPSLQALLIQQPSKASPYTHTPGPRELGSALGKAFHVLTSNFALNTTGPERKLR